MRKQKTTVKWRVLLRTVAPVLCGGIIGMNIYLANSETLGGNKLPMPFGYGAAVVLSGSMEPEMSRGDLIVVKQTDSFSERDVVVFQDKGSLVVHRIITIDGDAVITKGDANNVADTPITVEDIKGTVVCTVPFVGTLIGYIKTPVGTIVVLVAALLLLELPRRAEKKKDEKDREAILEEIRRLKTEMITD